MPRTADPKIRRAEIVDATTQVIASRGPEALTMRNIAQQANCTIGLINHWFGSKTELIEAALDHATQTAVERCSAILERPEASLDEITFEFLPLDDQRSDELRVWLVFWALSISRPELRKSHGKRISEMRRQLEEELERRGSVGEEVKRVVDTLMTALDGIAVNALADPHYWTPTKQMDTVRWLLKQIYYSNSHS